MSTPYVVLASKFEPGHIVSGSSERNEFNTGNILSWPQAINGGMPAAHAVITLSDDAHNFIANAYTLTTKGSAPLSSIILPGDESAISALHEVMQIHDPKFFDALTEEALEEINAEQGVSNAHFLFEAVKAKQIVVPLYTQDMVDNALSADPALADSFSSMSLEAFVAKNANVIDGVYPGYTQAPIKLSAQQLEMIAPLVNTDSIEPQQRVREVKKALDKQGMLLADNEVSELLSAPAAFRYSIDRCDRPDDLKKQAMGFSSLEELGYRCADHLKNHNTVEAYDSVTDIIHQKAYTSINYLADTTALVAYMYYYLGDSAPGSGEKPYIDTFADHQKARYASSVGNYFSQMELPGSFDDQIRYVADNFEFNTLVEAVSANPSHHNVATRTEALINGLQNMSSVSLPTCILMTGQSLVKIAKDSEPGFLENLARHAEQPVSPSMAFERPSVKR